MCIPGTLERVAENLSRRGFILSATKGAAAAGLASAATGCVTVNVQRSGDREPDVAGEGATRKSGPGFGDVVDLTHTYSSRFPHYRGGPSLVSLDPVKTSANDGWNVFQWTIDEHAGTHIDSPFHRHADGVTVDRIPARDLVLPLVVIDIREKARRDRDAQVGVDDLRAWEAEHGPIPPRACVAMLSGWDAKVDSPEFFGFDDAGVRHFPGFHLEAAQFLIEERDAGALALDTASLDFGPTVDYEVHTLWLGTGRWGLENVANLADVPPSGATIVCGAPKIAGASGGPSRVFALV